MLGKIAHLSADGRKFGFIRPVGQPRGNDVFFHLAALAIGVHLDELTIQGNADWLGRCYYQHCTDEQKGVILAAGPIAEQRYNGQARVSQWRSDLRQLVQYSKRLAGPSALAQSQRISAWQRQAREILDAAWPEVERFARLLLDRGRVDFRHLHRPEPSYSPPIRAATGHFALAARRRR